MSLQRFMAMAAGGVLIATAPISPLNAQAAPAAKPAPAAAAKVDPSFRADARFVREVAADNLLEVRAGELAQKRATRPEVKQYGQRMVTDHTRMQDQWIAAAAQHGMTLKPGMGPRHKAKLDRLQKAPAQAFDREYMTSMIENHLDDVSYFQNEGKSVHSEAVRNLVNSGLPVLQDHLNQAKQIAQTLGVDTAKVVRTRHVAARK